MSHTPFFTLLPEWAPQDAVLITWPHEESDWAVILPEVEETYLQLASAILRYQKLILVLPEGKSIAHRLSPTLRRNLMELHLPSNDTWARDYAPLTLRGERGLALADFQFNGWGLKFASNHDNMLARRLLRMGVFAPEVSWLNYQRFILEGGSVEINEEGLLLTTARCLLEENRNNFPHQLSDVEAFLKETLGAQEVLFLHHGDVAGDDTDGHVDTLVRFVTNRTLAYVAPTDPTSLNYGELLALEQELKAFVARKGGQYTLFPLPDVGNRYDPEGNPMPATYANFLFVNGALLVPTYNAPYDVEVLERLKQVLPDREVVGVDCQMLIRQHGSLHCATMQFPQGTLSPKYL